MRSEIKIGKQTITCEANALTHILYRNIYHKDFLQEMQAMANLKHLKGKKTEEITDDEITTISDRSDAFSRLAFIMKEQATGKSSKELFALTTYNYYDWLTGFEPDVFNDPVVLTAIIDLWKSNTGDSHIESKN